MRITKSQNAAGATEGRECQHGDSSIHAAMLFPLRKTPESQHLALVTLAAAGDGAEASFVHIINK